MKSRLVAAGLIVLLINLVGCGDKKTPTAPTPTPPASTPSVTLTTLVVTGPGCTAGSSATNAKSMVCLATVAGATIQLTATAYFSDGTTPNVTTQAQWTSSAASVATVSSAGLVTVKANGDTDAVAAYQGKTAGQTIRVAIPGQPVPPTTVTLLGTVTEAGNGPLAAANIELRDGPDARKSVLTDAVGRYTMSGLQPATVIVRAWKVGYVDTDQVVTLTGGTKTLNFTVPKSGPPPAPAPPVTPWTRSGQGDMVFDMPTYVSRVRIVGTYTGYSSNFIVYVGGDLLVNELIGTGWGPTRYDGTLLTTGGVVEIVHSSGVSWSFTEVR